MADNVRVDVSEINEFFSKVQNASGAFRDEMKTYLDAIGTDFLRVVHDEILSRKVLDTRLLLNSFEKGNSNNIWTISDGGMTLEVGTSVDYAGYVNDGHWTIDPSKHHMTLADGSMARFVPGTWKGDRFQYDPQANTGMVLRQKWVDGKPYFDSALRIYEKMFPDFLEQKMDEWLDKYFS